LFSSKLNGRKLWFNSPLSEYNEDLNIIEVKWGRCMLHFMRGRSSNNKMYILFGQPAGCHLRLLLEGAVWKLPWTQD